MPVTVPSMEVDATIRGCREVEAVLVAGSGLPGGIVGEAVGTGALCREASALPHLVEVDAGAARTAVGEAVTCASGSVPSSGTECLFGTAAALSGPAA